MRLASPRIARLLMTLTLGLGAAACAKDPGGGGGTGGSGGGATGGTGGAGGTDAGAMTDGGGSDSVYGPGCDPAASNMGLINVPAPLISVGKMVTASAGVTNAANVVDGMYHGTPAAAFPTTVSAASPGWIAIQIVGGADAGTDGGTGPSRLMLAWTDGGYMPFNTLAAGAPAAYHVEVSGDTTDGSDGTWTTVADVPANTVGARAHTFDFTGKTWVRFTVTAVATDSTNAPIATRIDEIEVHDISASSSARPADTWFFFGDSITQGAFQRDLNARFDTGIHADHPAYSPVMLNGGIAAELSHDGLRHIQQDGWLDPINPDFQHIAILFGTNDSWGDKDPASTDFEASMNAIVDAVLAAGRVPILGRIPFASEMAGQATMHATIPAFNAIIDNITATKNLPCGPDFYAYFQAHPEQLGPDGVHPAQTGYAAMNRLWTEAMTHLYP